MAFDEDLTVFFSDADFADVITRPDGSTFNAIYDETFFDPESGEMILSTTKPHLTCREIDTAGVIARKTVLTRKGVRYSVLDVKPDGTGSAVITLTKLVPNA